MRVVALGELCEIRSGGTPSRSNAAFYGGSIPWAKISDIEASNGFLDSTEESITDAGLKAIRGRLFPEGTLLFAIYGSIGKMAFASRQLSTNQAILGIQILDVTRVDARYLFRWLESRRDHLLADGLGIAQKNLSAGYLRALEIPLPPLEEQQRIAAILDHADSLRRLRRRTIDRLTTLGQAIFYDMFGDPSSRHEGWLKSKVANLCERVTVGVVVKPASYYQEIGVPAIRGTNIKNTGIDLSDVVYFSATDNEKKLAKTRVWQDDIVIVRSGRPGLAAVVPPELNGANSIDVLIATPIKSKIRPRFFRDLINSPEGRKIVLSESRGQVQQHFNVGSFSEAEFFLPPIDVQCQYEQALDRFEGQRQVLERSEKSIERLFRALQHSAFRGEL